MGSVGPAEFEWQPFTQRSCQRRIGVCVSEVKEDRAGDRNKSSF